jgi:hypothetical protein
MPIFKRLLFILGLIGSSVVAFSAEESAPWGDESWDLRIDPASGGLVQIANKHDALRMNWLREAGHWDRRHWVAANTDVSEGGQWGLVETAQTGLLHKGRNRKIDEKTWESVYVSSTLTVTVTRRLDGKDLLETFVFTNTGPIALDFPLGSVAISAPLFDQYPTADLSLTSRCHVHLWMGGSTAWINAVRMNTAPPHLGLVLTEGSLEAYSQRGTTLSDRGTFYLHPGAMVIPAGQSRTVGWRLFWHTGENDFREKRIRTPAFTDLSASRYVVETGTSLEVAIRSAGSLVDAKITANSRAIETRVVGNTLTASIPAEAPGEILVEVNDGLRRTWLRALVTPPLDQLVDARLRFIVKHQQRRADGDPLDGAYLVFDNETGRQIYAAKPSDHNAGRERLGMGVLGALYFPICQDAAFKAELGDSLKRYASFVGRELQDENGNVYGTIGRKNSERLYNHPWVAHFNLAMYQAFRDRSHLLAAVKNIHSFYAHGGIKFYPIGLPIVELLAALEQEGLDRERAELLARFREHADQIVKTGTQYPASEVNFEQSIVAPAVQILLEVYLATKDPAYLDAASKQLPLLEAFASIQPDHRLHEISIRHWDDYWFGKARLYGDTFPQYWSVLNGIVYARLAVAAGDSSWLDRAKAVVGGNLSVFSPDGRASAAHVYPFESNGRAGGFDDAWANDQDWALVYALLIREAAGR